MKRWSSNSMSSRFSARAKLMVCAPWFGVWYAVVKHDMHRGVSCEPLSAPCGAGYRQQGCHSSVTPHPERAMSLPQLETYTRGVRVNSDRRAEATVRGFG